MRFTGRCKEVCMHSLIYIVGVIVVALVILSVVGLA